MNGLSTLIEKLSELNPEGDPHGSLDPMYTKWCRDFAARATAPEKPLTLEEWKAYREAGDLDGAYGRDPLTADAPDTFLFVLRDHLVFTAGSTSFVINVISSFLDDHVNPRTAERLP